MASSWNGLLSRILPLRIAAMVPGPGYCHQEKIEWFLDQDMAIKSSWNGSWTRMLSSRVARMVPGPGYGHQE